MSQLLPIRQRLLSSSATSEGSWIRIGGMRPPFTLIVYGFASGDTAQIYVSNLPSNPNSPALAAPAAGDGTVQLGGDITSDVGTIVSEAWEWIRVRKSAAGGSPATTIADLYAQGGLA